jgi:hypothetical protein
MMEARAQCDLPHGSSSVVVVQALAVQVERVAGPSDSNA